MTNVLSAPPSVNVPHASLLHRILVLSTVYRRLQRTPEPTARDIACVERRFVALVVG